MLLRKSSCLFCKGRKHFWKRSEKFDTTMFSRAFCQHLCCVDPFPNKPLFSHVCSNLWEKENLLPCQRTVWHVHHEKSKICHLGKSLFFTKQKNFILVQIQNFCRWQNKCDRKFVMGWQENIVGKGENAGYQHFLLFLQCFQKVSFTGLLKVGIMWQIVNTWEWWEKCEGPYCKKILNLLWEKKSAHQHFLLFPKCFLLFFF